MQVFGTERVEDLVKGSWFSRLWEGDYGSLTVQGWLDSARSLERVREEQRRWVISSVKRVKRSDNDIFVEGVIEEFAPHLYR